MSAVPDEALLIRGGECRDQTLRKSALRCFERYGYLGLSVWADLEMSIEQLATVGNVKNGALWWGRAGNLKLNGFDIEYTGDPHHATVYLGEEIVDDTWERFRGSFEEMIRNPISL